MSELVQLSSRSDAPRFALLEKGFRPFFLLASLYAALVVPAWMVVHRGAFAPTSMGDVTSWHAHEMLFGFTVAVIAGFLLTAVSNWTGRVTAVRLPLAALALVFVAGRVVMATPGIAPELVAAVDLVFLPLVAVTIARPILATRNHRNLVFIAMLTVLALLDGMTHAAMLGWLPGGQLRGHTAALDVVIAIILVVTARIIPTFTKNATGAETRSMPWLDVVVVVVMLAVAVLDALGSPVAPWLALPLGVAVAVRAARWGWPSALRNPLLAILHVGHAWVAIGLVLRGVAAITPAVPLAAATHALAAGAIGSLTLGMLARVTKGHTGRLLENDLASTAAFALVTIAAVARVAAALVLDLYRPLLDVAGTCFAAAFAVYLLANLKALLTRRVDGKPG